MTYEAGYESFFVFSPKSSRHAFAQKVCGLTFQLRVTANVLYVSSDDDDGIGEIVDPE